MTTDYIKKALNHKLQEARTIHYRITTLCAVFHFKKDYCMLLLQQQNCWDWKVPLEVFGPPPAQRSVNYIRLLKAMPSQVFIIFKDGDYTTTLGNLSQGMTTLASERFFLCLSISVCASCPVTFFAVMLHTLWEYLEISTAANPPV